VEYKLLLEIVEKKREDEMIYEVPENVCLESDVVKGRRGCALFMF
jgi:hypothetical protein